MDPDLCPSRASEQASMRTRRPAPESGTPGRRGYACGCGCGCESLEGAVPDCSPRCGTLSKTTRPRCVPTRPRVYLGHAPFLSATAPPPPPPPTTTPTTATRRAVASTEPISTADVAIRRGCEANERSRQAAVPCNASSHLAVDVQCSDSIPHTVAQVGDVCARNVPALDAVSTTGIIHRPYCSA
jgi:hypothetical protein